MSSKSCPNLRRGLRRVVLNDLDVGDMVSVGVEMMSEPGPEEVLRACATAPASAGCIVGDDEELKVHGES